MNREEIEKFIKEFSKDKVEPEKFCTQKHYFEKTHEHHIPHFYHVNHLADKFHVVTVVSNPVMYKSRYRLFKKFEQHMRESGVQHLHVIEVQNGNRAFQVTEEGNPYLVYLK